MGGAVWHGMAWYCMVWCGMVWCGMVWHCCVAVHPYLSCVGIGDGRWVVRCGGCLYVVYRW